ncbi:hypothetical protein DPMN_078433 [Dreissena polymorpha]|uniref:Uncharacterized protein n=1 Tax=Dreissena polymorpha TaxID=45954 RepID=A0A9D3YRS3_DREPO|nr:hypothetical protein DPMN_078412 [Dreissena polymorpha]KAH3703397.1 hypothetical protein DPMN_078433 [Dreissena polymorpha]
MATSGLDSVRLYVGAPNMYSERAFFLVDTSDFDRQTFTPFCCGGSAAPNIAPGEELCFWCFRSLDGCYGDRMAR